MRASTRMSGENNTYPYYFRLRGMRGFVLIQPHELLGIRI